jgi:hypothetical protein
MLALIGIGIINCGPAKNVNYAPYCQAETSQIYNLLFCDDLSLYKCTDGEKLSYWQSILFADVINNNAILELAEDTTQEGRIRALAYNLLKKNGLKTPERKLLGVIIEVSLENGLDVLAAFSDGGVRYINQTGKMAIVEGGIPEIDQKVKKLFELSQKTISIIGPWDKQRLPPPEKGIVRLTFIVSDGLYFGQGPMDQMLRDPLSASILVSATTIMQNVTSVTLKKQE